MQVGSELKAELGNVHTLSGKPAGEESKSQRGGALGTRAGRERARARGGRGRRPERAQLGPSEPRGAQSWERPAGGRAPLSHPSPAAPGAAPSSAEPHPGALAPPRCPGTGGGSARSRPVPPARGLLGGSASASPEGVRTSRGQPRPPARSCSRVPRDARAPGPPGAVGKEEAEEPGRRARAPGILGGEVAGLGPVPYRSPKAAWGAREERWEPSSPVLSWKKLSGEPWLRMGESFA